MYFLYPFLKPLFFQMDPEKVHMGVLKALKYLNFLFFEKKIPEICKRDIFGITVRSPVFLAAGFDKEGLYFPYLAKLGFGGIEVGSFTLNPQEGNEPPRLFRFPQKKALVNRMGFNNPGIKRGLQNILKNLNKVPEDFLLGISLGKGKNTPLEEAVFEYNKMLDFISENLPKKKIYLAINISSPNTPGLKNLQMPFFLKKFLKNLKKNFYPLLIKLSYDFSSFDELAMVLELIHKAKMDGVILTNTSSDLSLVQEMPLPKELGGGGVSGEPLREKSRFFLEEAKKSFPELTFFSSGGVMDPAEVLLRLKKGASAVQVYTGLIYYGPQIVDKSHFSLSRFGS